MHHLGVTCARFSRIRVEARGWLGEPGKVALRYETSDVSFRRNGHCKIIVVPEACRVTIGGERRALLGDLPVHFFAIREAVMLCRWSVVAIDKECGTKKRIDVYGLVHRQRTPYWGRAALVTKTKSRYPMPRGIDVNCMSNG